VKRPEGFSTTSRVSTRSRISGSYSQPLLPFSRLVQWRSMDELEASGLLRLHPLGALRGSTTRRSEYFQGTMKVSGRVLRRAYFRREWTTHAAAPSAASRSCQTETRALPGGLGLIFLAATVPLSSLYGNMGPRTSLDSPPASQASRSKELDDIRDRTPSRPRLPCITTSVRATTLACAGC